MKTKRTFIKHAALLVLLSTLNPQLSTLFAQGTAFNYEGRLNVGGNPATGIYDLRFAIYDSLSAGTEQGFPLTNSATGVTNGLFSVTLDFGPGIFNGADRWLEINVRTNGTGTFSLLTPRQKILPAPYAMYSASAAISASYSGPVALSQLPASVALLNSNQTFTGTVSFSNPSNSFAGSGAGLNGVRWSQLNGEGVIKTDNPFFVPASPVPYPNVGAFPWSVAVADFNGDGKPDVAVINSLNDNTVYTLTNNGSGGLVFASSNAVAASSSQVVAADVNTDGKMDLIVAHASGSTLEVFTNDGNGGFQLASSPVGADFVTAADLNGDGKVDLITDGAGGGEVLTNIGGGNFAVALSSIAFGQSAAAADVNGDGRVDIIGASGNSVQILTNNGAGGFTLASSTSVGPGQVTAAFILAADVNGDGRIDLITANRAYNVFPPFGSTVSVLTNNGNGSFTLSLSVTGDFAFPYNVAPLLATADLNGDGRMDIVTANGYTNTVSVLVNNGGGSFHLASYPVAGALGGWIGLTTVAVADVNGDGRPDILATSPSELSLDILTNTSSTVFETPLSVNGLFTVSGVSALNNPSNSFAGTFSGGFSGSGAGLTGVNADLIDGIDSTALARINAGQTFSGTNTFNATSTFNSNVVINPPATLSFGNGSGRQMLNLWGTQYGIGVQSYTTYFRTDNSFPGGDFAWYQGGVHNDNQLNPGGGKTLMVLDRDGSLHVTNSVFAGSVLLTSDRNAKENFTPVNAGQVLEKVTALPLTEWNFKSAPPTRHIGPMAQDFQTAFQVGEDDTHIAVVDEGGVALAAIQGLNEKVEVGSQKSEVRIRKLEAENAELRQRLEALEKIIRNQKSN